MCFWSRALTSEGTWCPRPRGRRLPGNQGGLKCSHDPRPLQGLSFPESVLCSFLHVFCELALDEHPPGPREEPAGKPRLSWFVSKLRCGRDAHGQEGLGCLLQCWKLPSVFSEATRHVGFRILAHGEVFGILEEVKKQFEKDRKSVV